MDKTRIIASAEAENIGEAYTTRVLVSERQYIVDEPKVFGGNDEGPAPAEYVCMALASCKAITLRMYANRKKWEAGEMRVKVNMVKQDFACTK
jgi:putative redox protein